MSNSELKDAIECAKTLVEQDEEITAAELVVQLNAFFNDSEFYAQGNVVYMKAEPDYLKPFVVVVV